MVSITIVIITHERQALLERASESVARALVPLPEPVEVLVLDSSEHPGKRKLPHGFRELHVPRLQSAVQKRDLAWRLCATEWIVYLDDDCEMEPFALQSIFEVIASNTHESVGAYYCITGFAGTKGFWFSALEDTDFLSCFSEARKGEDLAWGPTSLAVFSRSALAAVNGFDRSMDVNAGGEDVDVGLRIRQAGWRQCAIPKQLVVHTTETWDNWRANLRRSFNYGQAEYHLLERWPEYRAWDTQALVWYFLVWALLFVILSRCESGSYCLSAASVLYWLLWIAGGTAIQSSDYRKAFLPALALAVLDLSDQLGHLHRAVGTRGFGSLGRKIDWNLLNSRGRERTSPRPLRSLNRWLLALLPFLACLIPRA